jgi:hypothetical protein
MSKLACGYCLTNGQPRLGSCYKASLTAKRRPGAKRRVNMAGKTEETKKLCSRCFKEVTSEQIAFEDSEKKEIICYFCKEALKREKDEEKKA